MGIDLQKGISLKIEGELGKYQTLPIDFLIKIAESLQELVLSIAKYDIPTNESIDLNNFKLELSDYQKGSAIPSFVLTQRVQPVLTDYQNQRVEVSNRLNNLFDISDKGTYYDLRNLYPEPNIRNEMVEKLYCFTSSFNDSPVLIYERGDVKDSIEVYRPKKFKLAVKKRLIVEIKEPEIMKSEEKAFASIKVTRRGGKRRNSIESKRYSL